MNSLEKMEQDIKKALPGAWTRVRRAKSKTGTWFLDVKLDEHVLIATWSPRHGLGLSASALGGDGYGEGPEEVFEDIASATSRAIQLLKEKAYTAPPQEVFLRELRAIAGVTQAELAERLGVQQAAVSKLERRSDITLASLRRFVDALGAKLEINVRTKSGELVKLLDAPEPETRAACDHVESALVPSQREAPRPDYWLMHLSEEHVRESLSATQKRYSELLRHHLGVARQWTVICDGDVVDGRNLSRLAASSDDGVVTVSPARVWELSEQVAADLGVSPERAEEKSTVVDVFEGALRYLVAHEMGHAVDHFVPNCILDPACGTGSLVSQQLAAEPELRADTIAGWLAAKAGEDPCVGAEVAAKIGCEEEECEHPSRVARSSFYVMGFACGARSTRENTPCLENLVLYAADIERSRHFYEGLGLEMTEERHGDGPRHFSCSFGSTVFEIYPSSAQRRAGSARLCVSGIRARHKYIIGSFARSKDVDAQCSRAFARVRTDPDGNRIETRDEGRVTSCSLVK